MVVAPRGDAVSLGRPTPASATDPVQLFQVLTGLYDELRKKDQQIADLRQLITISVGGDTNITIGTGGNGSGAPAFDGGDMGDVFSDMPISIPGRDGVIGRDGRPGFGMDGDSGDDGQPGPPGNRGADGSPGANGTAGVSNVPGPAGNDGDDGIDGGARMDFSGLPLGALPAEFDTTGDVMRGPNGDSRIRGQDGIYYYSRIVAGPYGVSFGVLTIEDNAVLMVL